MTWELIGHRWAIDLLIDRIASGRVGHAYLITGPDGIGKRTIAMRFAMALNCEVPPQPGEYCGTCRSCRLMDESMHPDLHILTAEAEGAVLKVDQVRELQRQLALTPYQGTWRIALIPDFQHASESAFNALLKTLEEPPPAVILILTAEQAETLPETIVSRCEVLPMRAVPTEEIVMSLTAKAIDPDQAELIARVSAGRPGVALQFIAEPEMIENRIAKIDEMVQVLAMNRSARMRFVDELVRGRDLSTQRVEISDLLTLWQGVWRDILLISSDSGIPLSNPDYQESLEETAHQLSLQQTMDVLRSIQHTLEAISLYANNRLAMENLVLGLPQIPPR
jgi:DNA polymerase-3 subunit delta'